MAATTSFGVSEPADREPTREQQLILNAYADMPNAAAVARALGKSERNVRRVCDQFRGQLEEGWAERDAELTARAEARRRRVLDWIDEGLARAMEQLDALMESTSESVRLRACKVRIDLALRQGEREASKLTPAALRDVTQEHLAELQQTLDSLISDDGSGG